MWQEILVGVIVALCAFFVARGYWKNLKGARSEKIACSCDCTGCNDASATGSSDCDQEQIGENTDRS